MDSPFLGTIVPTAIQYNPVDWVFCRGQTMSIQQYTALYALLGVVYGGDAKTNFLLPNLSSRTVVGTGTGPGGLSTYQLGQSGGSETATAAGLVPIGLNNLPAHTHPATMTMSGLSATTTLNASTSAAGTGAPSAGAGLTAATSGQGSASIYATPTPTAGLVALGNISTTVSGSGSVTVGSTGAGQPVAVSLPLTGNKPNLPPFLALNFIIAVNGLFPSRN